MKHPNLHPLSSSFIHLHPLSSTLIHVDFHFNLVCQGHIEQIGTIKPKYGWKDWMGSLNGLAIRASNGAKNIYVKVKKIFLSR